MKFLAMIAGDFVGTGLGLALVYGFLRWKHPGLFR